MAKHSDSGSTIADVAKRAGVSLSTVSRVMNGNVKVDPAMTARVRAAAVELKYTASPLARSLVLGKTQTVAVVVPDLANPTFHAILRGLSRAAADDGYHVLVADSAEDIDTERTLATTTRRRTDGLVLCAPRLPDSELDALLPSLGPVVLINRQSAGIPSVSADYGSAFTLLLDHLYERGHRRLLFLAGGTRSASERARRDAAARFVATHSSVELTTRDTGVDMESGARAAADVRDSGATAVLAFNDLVATGLVTALAAQGVRVPEDIAVTGFDDIPFARYLSPPLTTASVPAFELGAVAWALLHALLTAQPVPGAQTLYPQIVPRASTAATP
ncbi:LacI family transcriptional regulator [Microbacterium halimionae]|uniref:LacI family transcriptional regulator n=1 Tax=Microbacterium halimionae TaxID=1526413 RepID=A0A7W3JQR8_9MICO|nr:LacI family DNA-binding transcriptional regulator [Microbacterium halimionae]MBA8817231.1 LacI family transcriptional regulator [Microbacterium halimionae]NII94681.1 LacI family transcriptional regulator [Microbacterium halimionae]